MNLLEKSGQNSSSFSKCPAVGLDRGLPLGLTTCILSSCPCPLLCCPLHNLPSPGSGPIQAKPQALGKIHV